MKKNAILLILIVFIGCNNKVEKEQNSVNKIYNSNDVVKVDNMVYFKRDMTKVTGIVQGFYSNGNNKEAYLVKDGILDGFSNSWNEYGQQRYEGNYKNGEKDGLWRFWWPDGQLKGESTYKDGKLNGIRKEWNEYGELISEEVWINNNKQ